MNLKTINIVDPCFSKNNLGKSISTFNSYRLKECLKYHSYKLRKAYKSPVPSRLYSKLCHQFRFTLESAGMSRGVLMQLPQISVKQKRSAEKDLMFDLDDLVIDEPGNRPKADGRDLNEDQQLKIAHDLFKGYLRQMIGRLQKSDPESLAHLIEGKDDGLAK